MDHALQARSADLQRQRDRSAGFNGVEKCLHPPSDRVIIRDFGLLAQLVEQLTLNQ